MKNETKSAFFSFELNKDALKKPTCEGNLTIKDDEIKLVFCKIDAFLNYKFDDKFYDKNLCIYGQTVIGEKFTIDNYSITPGCSQTVVSGEILLFCQTININRIFMGDWISDVNNLKINNLSVRFSYFEYWFEQMDWFKQMEVENKREYEFVIPVKQFESDFNATIDERLNIELAYYSEKKIKANRTFTFNSKRFLKLNFPKTIKINDALDKVFILQNLFQVLLTNEKVFVVDLQFDINEQKIVVYQAYSNYVSEKDNINWYDFLYSFNEKESEELFIKWFSLYEKYGRIFGIIIANLAYQPNSYIKNNFLSKIQWIEGFCRIKYPTTKEQKDEHKGKLEEIKKNLKGNDLEYFNKITNYPYETNLITQLKRVIGDCNILNIIGGSEDKLIEFIETSKRNRDNLTHGKNKQIVKLFYQNIFLEYLIRIILIRELELSPDSPAYNRYIKNIIHCYDEYHAEDN